MGAISKHEDGRPVMTDGKLEALQTQYTLTRPEAEQLFGRVADGEAEATAADQIKAARTVNVPATQAIPAAESHPLEVAEKRHKAEAEGKPPASPERTAPVPEPGGSVTRSSDIPR